VKALTHTPVSKM